MTHNPANSLNNRKSSGFGADKKQRIGSLFLVPLGALALLFVLFVNGSLSDTSSSSTKAASPVATSFTASPPAPNAAPKEVSNSSVLSTGVTFKTSDHVLQQVYDSAESKSLKNIRNDFPQGMRVLIEGWQYRSAWIETQPMGGAMWAKRDAEVARNNQMVFLLTQREDGRFPGEVYPQANNSFGTRFDSLQGYCFPMPAYQVYFFVRKDQAYLKQLYKALEAYDNYLWRERIRDGVLTAEGIGDSGEDGTTRFDGHGGPFQSMDVMGYSYDGRAVLALISRELGNGQESYWRAKAEEVKAQLAKTLWRSEKHACYDKDNQLRWLETLAHNNLRAMYHGVFTQQMADEFLRYHLLNPKDFWTPMPLTSIGASEKRFINVSGNNWGGQPQGLTYQRAIRALENYGHYAEVGLIGKKLLQAVGRANKFPQQFDPYTGEANRESDSYGPTMLATLEYIGRMYGIEPALWENKILWSGLKRVPEREAGLGTGNAHTIEYSQMLGSESYTLQHKQGYIYAARNGVPLFRCEGGVRVVTDLQGKVFQVIGIDSATRSIKLREGSVIYALTVRPNEVWQKGAGRKFVLKQRVPFDYSYAIAENGSKSRKNELSSPYYKYSTGSVR